MAIRVKARVVHKTTHYTINPAVDRPGTLFTNGGAIGAVNFTLPRPVRALLGDVYHVAGLVDQDLGIVGATAGDLITVNNAAAASVTFSTSSQKIGARATVECVETSLNSGTFKWLVVVTSTGITGTVA